MTTVLKLRDISKSFGAVRALEGVSLELAAGEVHALVGENGAGKSTLIKIITGAYEPDSGEVEIAGRRVTDFDPLTAKALGVAVVYQQPTLFPDLSIAENLALGVESPSPWRWIDWHARKRKARDLLAHVGADLAPDAEAGSLSMPEQQLVEIARALGQDARILIMDEPTASLSTREVDHLFGVIDQLRTSGVAILYVSHRLEELS
ncbi:MAG: ATP-binding cassette domain-containing protein, partial [Aureliella sp.]